MAQIDRERNSLTGFTLIELLIATFIIGLTLVVAIEMFVVTTKTSEESGNDVIALNLVQQRLEEVKKLQYGGVNITVGTGNNAADGFLPALTDVSTDVYLTGFYLTDSNTYRSNSSLAKMNPQRRLDLITRINWVDDPYGGTTQDYKQVNVTAFWQESGKIKSLSLSTYASYVGLQSIGEGVTVPDTGQTLNYTSSFGEDSDYNTTAQLSYIDNGDGTIEDEITGLTWVKDPVAAGIGGTHTWLNAVANCTGLIYATRDDWRLPNIKELWSIVHYQNTPRTIAPVFNCTDILPRRYWSSTTNSGQTLAIDFTTGQCSGQATSVCVRPVRDEGRLVDSGQTTSYTPGDDGANNPPAIQPNFTDNEDGTISDNISGLMWIKNPGGVAGIGGTYSWENAIAACENLDYANSIKWRLPNVKELMSVLNYQYNNPAIATGAGNFTVTSGTYWTSTSDVAGGLPNDNAVAVNLGDGTSLSSPKTNPYRILPVCGGEL